MSFVSQSTGYWFLLIFGLAMLAVTYFFARRKNVSSKEGFLVAGRQVGWFLGGSSIAASWIWAPALFVSVQLAYQKGLAGIFWFTFPNIIALVIFAFLAPKIRELLPDGFTFPQYIKYRLYKNYHNNMLKIGYNLVLIFSLIILLPYQQQFYIIY